jgi:hypothetical protein
VEINGETSEVLMIRTLRVLSAVGFLCAAVGTLPAVVSAGTEPTPSPTPFPTPAPCGVFSLCPEQPQTDCKRDLDPGRGNSSILLHDVPTDKSDRIVYKWAFGDPTTMPDFGDPVNTTNYELCIYDGNDHLLSRACAPADGLCNGKPCWKGKSRGFRYRRRDLSPSGLKNSLQLTLTAGSNAEAKILVKGKGPIFPMPDMPIDMPVTVQLLNSNGVCWETEFFPPATLNRPGDFKDEAEGD